MKQAFALFALLVVSSWLYASTPVTPNTTLSAEAGNNTSAASSFQSQSNGNLGASNISKAQIKTLLYPGFNGKLYVHFMAWFGGTNHMNVGYESDSATQVASQVADMLSRGVDGAIVDWYGPNNARVDGTTQLLRAEAEKHDGQFQFAVMEDVGALQSCANTAGCDITGQLISDLTYAYYSYELSPAYIAHNGRPVVFFFGEEAYAIDWARVAASVPGDPLFIQRNAGTFTNASFNGAFAWPSPNAADPTDMGNAYLDYFYKIGVANPRDLAYGTGYKGFNDYLASWTAHRITNQNCGQTFLDTFSQIAAYYSVNTQLFAVQLATWNDYEEGTELETGIDNCVSITASAAATQVSWSITGSATLIDHYTVFVSTDGENLMTVADVPASQRSYDFSGYGLAQGSYTVYVKAVGTPFMLNHMSGAVALTIASPMPTAKLTVMPSSTIVGMKVTANTAASTAPSGSIAKSTIDFGDGTLVAAASAAHIYTKPGTYMVAATVTDHDGVSAQTATSVSIMAPSQSQRPVATPIMGRFTASPGVTVSSPLPNSTSPASVKFVASARAVNPITAMRIYVDNVGQYTVNAAAINTTLTLAKGLRAITVQAWDSKGTVYKSSMSITVN
jgi:PKD repeat protein